MHLLKLNDSISNEYENIHKYVIDTEGTDTYDKKKSSKINIPEPQFILSYSFAS